MKDWERSSKIVYEELRKYNLEIQVDILRDCGLSNLIDTHKIVSNTESFELMLKGRIDIIKEKYGNEIKGATWNGIREKIINK